MTTWRMSFRAGNQGPKMWSKCLLFGVAAITYDALAVIDLSMHPPGEPKSLWAQLEPRPESQPPACRLRNEGGRHYLCERGAKNY